MKLVKPLPPARLIVNLLVHFAEMGCVKQEKIVQIALKIVFLPQVLRPALVFAVMEFVEMERLPHLVPQIVQLVEMVFVIAEKHHRLAPLIVRL